MKTLNDRLTEKARSEFERLYYSTVQGAVGQIRRVLGISETTMRKDQSLGVLWNMQYNPESGRLINELFPAYAETYIEGFIKKVEEAQAMLEEHTHD